MSDWTSIFNQAVLPLGQREIASFDENSTSARKCRAVYLNIADEVLYSHPWKCALARALLAAASAAPVFGPQFAYTLPADPFCLRAWRVGDSDGNWYDEDTGKWEVEGTQILTDLPAPLKLRYISRVTDPGLFSAMLATAISCRLRAEVAFTITASKDNELAAMKDYTDMLAQARSLDSQQGTPERLGQSRILEARW